MGKKEKITLTPEQREFAKVKRFVQKRFPGARTVARTFGGTIMYQVVDERGISVIDPELRIPHSRTVKEAWDKAKYGAWFQNMIRKSNNAFSDEKIYKKLAKEKGDD